MSWDEAPAIVRAAIEQQGIDPEDLLGVCVSGPGVYLSLRSGVDIRVEISSLPEDVARARVPENTSPMGPDLAAAGFKGPDRTQDTGFYFPWLSERLHIALEEAGYDNVALLRSLSTKDLMEVPGIGKATAKRILEAVGAE